MTIFVCQCPTTILNNRNGDQNGQNYQQTIKFVGDSLLRKPILPIDYSGSYNLDLCKWTHVIFKISKETAYKIYDIICILRNSPQQVVVPNRTLIITWINVVYVAENCNYGIIIYSNFTEFCAIIVYRIDKKKQFIRSKCTSWDINANLSSFHEPEVASAGWLFLHGNVISSNPRKWRSVGDGKFSFDIKYKSKWRRWRFGFS